MQRQTAFGTASPMEVEDEEPLEVATVWRRRWHQVVAHLALHHIYDPHSVLPLAQLPVHVDQRVVGHHVGAALRLAHALVDVERHGGLACGERGVGSGIGERLSWTRSRTNTLKAWMV